VSQRGVGWYENYVHLMCRSPPSFMFVRFRALTARRSSPLHKSPTPKDGSKQASTTCYSQTAIHPLAKTSPMCDHQRLGEHLCQYGARLYGIVSSASARQLSSPRAVSTRSFSQASEEEVPRQVCLFGRKPPERRGDGDHSAARQAGVGARSRPCRRRRLLQGQGHQRRRQECA